MTRFQFAGDAKPVSIAYRTLEPTALAALEPQQTLHIAYPDPEHAITTVTVTRQKDDRYALAIQYPYLSLLHEVLYDRLKLAKHELENTDLETAQRVLDTLSELSLNKPPEEMAAPSKKGLYSAHSSGSGLVTAFTGLDQKDELSFKRYLLNEHGSQGPSF